MCVVSFFRSVALLCLWSDSMRLEKCVLCEQNRKHGINDLLEEKLCAFNKTHTQKIKRKVQNTRIDWFGSRVFWPSSILLQMIKRHTSTKKIQPTKININTKVSLDNVLFFRITSNYHHRIKSPKKHGHCFPQANLISKVFWEQYSKHIVFQSIHNFFSLSKKMNLFALLLPDLH